jgi:hypothetical protein
MIPKVLMNIMAIVGLIACAAVFPGNATENAGYLEVPVNWNCSVSGEVPDDKDETLTFLENNSVWFLVEDNRQCMCQHSALIKGEKIRILLAERYPNATLEIDAGPDGMFNLTDYSASDFGDGLYEIVNDPRLQNKAVGYAVLNDNSASLSIMLPSYYMVNMTIAQVEGWEVSHGTQDIVTKVVVFEP